jgi:hypothetical protein
VCRVFWRAGVPWVLLRCRSGALLPLPGSATDLPLPVPDADARGNAHEAVLLTPTALRELAHFVASRPTGDDPISTMHGRQR